MNTVSRPARNLAVGLTAVCAIAFAPLAHGLATFEAIAEEVILTLNSNPDPDEITVTAEVINEELEAEATGNATASASTEVNGTALAEYGSVSVGLLEGESLLVVAEASGSAGVGGAAEAASLNEIEVVITSTDDEDETLSFTLSYDIDVDFATDYPFEEAFARALLVLLDAQEVELLNVETTADADGSIDFEILVPALATVEFEVEHLNVSGFAIPEPTSLLLLGMGLAGLGFARRRAA